MSDNIKVMLLNFPCYIQKTDYDCGPAALKTALASFGIRTDLKELQRQLRTTERDGTTRRNMVRTARGYGLKVSAHTAATLEEVGRLVRRGSIMIVGYILPQFEGGHYAVVSGLDKRFIYLHDPTEGRYFRLTREEFRRRWYGRHKKTHTRWLMTLEAGRAAGVGPARNKRPRRAR